MRCVKLLLDAGADLRAVVCLDSQLVHFCVALILSRCVCSGQGWLFGSALRCAVQAHRCPRLPQYAANLHLLRCSRVLLIMALSVRSAEMHGADMSIKDFKVLDDSAASD